MKPIFTVALASSVALGACTASNDPVYTQFYREAGALVDTGQFGNATANNTLILTGERQYTFDLAQRFATEVGTTVNFAFNSSQLDAGARDALREQAVWIRQFPEIRFRVYGHTDAVGSAAYNKRLGLARANAVVSFLTSQGISRSAPRSCCLIRRNAAVDRHTRSRTPQSPHRDRSQRLRQIASSCAGRQVCTDRLPRLCSVGRSAQYPDRNRRFRVQN